MLSCMRHLNCLPHTISTLPALSPLSWHCLCTQCRVVVFGVRCCCLPSCSCCCRCCSCCLSNKTASSMGRPAPRVCNLSNYVHYQPHNASSYAALFEATVPRPTYNIYRQLQLPPVQFQFQFTVPANSSRTSVSCTSSQFRFAGISSDFSSICKFQFPVAVSCSHWRCNNHRWL